MRTKAEIYRQIDGLLNEKKSLPLEREGYRFDKDGINAKIDVLRCKNTAEDFGDPSEFTEYVYEMAVDAENWMEEQNEIDLFTDI